MHNKPHTLEAKLKIREAQRKWRKTPDYLAFVERQRERAKKSPTQFKKGHDIHTRFPTLREKIKPFQNGIKHWNWQGGITPEVIKVRNSRKYASWRSKVFERDDYTCQVCGKRGDWIEADHYPKTFSELWKAGDWNTMWDIVNGRTLCRACHDKTKTRYA